MNIERVNVTARLGTVILLGAQLAGGAWFFSSAVEHGREELKVGKQALEEVSKIRTSMEVFQKSLHELEVRTARLEERSHVSSEWRDTMKGNP